MRIVQINEVCGVGSTGRTTLELAEGLRAQGHFAYVLYASGSTSYPDSARIGNSFDHKLHALLSRLTGMQGYFSSLATRRMLGQLAALKPEVVHLRNLHGNYINLGMLLRWLAKNDIPVVLTLHDCWFMTGKCTHYRSANCEKWKTCCGHCPLLHIDNMNPTWFLDRTKKCYLDKKRWFGAIPRLAVAGVSQWISGEARQSIFKDRQIVTIYNWIDTETFTPREAGAEAVRERYQLGRTFVVLMVTSQLADSKGYRELLGLAETLDEGCKLVLVGRNGMRLPLPSNVLYIPPTSDAAELADWYSAADVCVNTTQFETFGKVTAEALCCGTPVIVYRNTASPELVGPGCGYTVEEADGLNGILQALKEIRQRGKAAYTQDCLAFARERFAMEKSVAQYVKLYRDVTKPRPLTAFLRPNRV